ncbi:hypothetical protein AAFF_G00199610 [Aldrovandia affinis]|uniref:B30.2/SPRY domain-containing protein n=1 Tax=Aldrovandia affinis TaxID=143900 RepID=A0AAD7W6H1_9TELE|nr:hypothetical protein AAFF_G00199610 [Aldrovandia affinis]
MEASSTSVHGLEGDLGVPYGGEEGSHRCSLCGGDTSGTAGTRGERAGVLAPVCWACRTLARHKVTGEVAQRCKGQARQTERQIKEEFEKLHRFLREEEEARIAALREEEEQKSRVMKETMEKMTGRFPPSLVWGSPENPEKVPGALIDVAKHLSNLKHRVWEKMLETVQYTPVTLDPNTAEPFLVVSADLTSVSDGNVLQPLPDNPERFSRCAETLGSRGLGPGTHRWDVELGDNTNWIVGVARATIPRKRVVSACPENGVWGVCLRGGEYEALESPSVPLRVRAGLRRVLVQLDWDGGEVTFSDPTRRHPSLHLHAPLHREVVPLLLHLLPIPASENRTCAACSGQEVEDMSALRPLEEKLQAFYEASDNCDQVFKHALGQARQTERQIKEEFEKLHRFLREEEEARIAALREEEEQKSRVMKETMEKVKGEASSLSDTLKAMEATLEDDELVFLQGYGETMKRAWGSPENPEKVPGALIDVAKHLSNLKHRVWEKMLETVQYTPVILDPNTAAPSLVLSDALTQGGHGDEGRSGSSSPTTRRGSARTPASWAPGPWVRGGTAGKWSLGDGEYRAMGSPCSLLQVPRPLRRVRVQLDWDGGEVTFSDPTDGTPLYTFTHPFTERVYPYFESACGRWPLKVLPEKVYVRAEESPIGHSHTRPPSDSLHD